MAGTYKASKTKKFRKLPDEPGEDDRGRSDPKPSAKPTPVGGKKKLSRKQRREKREAKLAEVKRSRLIARGEAEIVYEPTHFAPAPLRGVDLGGSFELALPSDERNVRKRSRKTIAGIKGPVSKASDIRRHKEPTDKVRVSREGNTIVVPSTRKVQVALEKEHEDCLSHEMAKYFRLMECEAELRDKLLKDKVAKALDPAAEPSPKVRVTYRSDSAVSISRTNTDRLSRRLAVKAAKNSKSHPELYAAMMEGKGVANAHKSVAKDSLPGDWRTKSSVERKLAMSGKLVKKPGAGVETDQAWSAARRKLKVEQRKKAAELASKAAA